MECEISLNKELLDIRKTVKSSFMKNKKQLMMGDINMGKESFEGKKLIAR